LRIQVVVGVYITPPPVPRGVILVHLHVSASMQLTYEHLGLQMSGKGMSQKEASESITRGSTYGRVDFIHAEARIQIREWRD